MLKSSLNSNRPRTVVHWAFDFVISAEQKLVGWLVCSKYLALGSIAVNRRRSTTVEHWLSYIQLRRSLYIID